MTRLRRALASTRAYSLDLMVIAGVGAIALGLAQLPAPWGAVFAPVTVGVALLLVVRLAGDA